MILAPIFCISNHNTKHHTKKIFSIIILLSKRFSQVFYIFDNTYYSYKIHK